MKNMLPTQLKKYLIKIKIASNKTLTKQNKVDVTKQTWAKSILRLRNK